MTILPDDLTRTHEDGGTSSEGHFVEVPGSKPKQDNSLQYWEQNHRIPSRSSHRRRPSAWAPVVLYVRRYVLRLIGAFGTFHAAARLAFHHSHMVGSSAIGGVQRQAKQKLVPQGQTRREVRRKSSRRTALPLSSWSRISQSSPWLRFALPRLELAHRGQSSTCITMRATKRLRQ